MFLYCFRKVLLSFRQSLFLLYGSSAASPPPHIRFTAFWPRLLFIQFYSDLTSLEAHIGDEQILFLEETNVVE